MYRVETAAKDEIVAKCTIFDKDSLSDEIQAAYDSIFYESQTLKMCRNQHMDYLAQIKEEIIEINMEK